MGTKIKYSFFTLILTLAITQAAGQGKPTWRFTILAGISDTTANYYGGFSNACNLIRAQIDTVNVRFNNPGVFNGIFQFEVDSIYGFSGNAYNEVFKPHPNHSFRVIYDGFPTQGGGWFGDYAAIYGAWPVDYFGGTFGDYATDGAVHEFGHARGTIDLYALAVDANNNPVNDSAYQPETSIMNYPYGVRVWDTHSINIINSNTDIPSPPISYITEAFPGRIGFKVCLSDGTPVSNAELILYPVQWYSYSLNTAMSSRFTDSTGHFFFGTNPFRPKNCNYPWCIRYCNFLVSAEHMETVLYQWMPLTEVQNFYFEYPESTFCLTFIMDASVVEDSGKPIVFKLNQNYPNPFNSTTTIKYTLPNSELVTLTIFDMLGREVTKLVESNQQRGNYEITFNGNNLPSGIYIYRLQAGNLVEYRKMALMR